MHWVTDLRLLGARGQHLRVRPVGVGPEDHPLLLVVQGEAMVKQLGALLAPVATPVAAVGAEAIEAGTDVESLDSGHDVLLEYVDGVCRYKPLTAHLCHVAYCGRPAGP